MVESAFFCLLMRLGAMERGFGIGIRDLQRGACGGSRWGRSR